MNLDYELYVVSKIVRRGCKRTRVRFTDDTEALVPAELAVVGQRFDKIRFFPIISNGKEVLEWVGDLSYRYKHKKAVDEIFSISDEIYHQFHEIVEACVSKFVGFRWVQKNDRKEVVDDFYAYAFLSGIIYRMSKRNKALWGGYVYSCLKGWLINRHNKWCKEKRMFVSYEECANFLLVDECGEFTSEGGQWGNISEGDFMDSEA
jgi:hypothetical protein